MEAVLQQPLASDNLPVDDGKEKTSPFSHETVLLTKREYIQLKWEANYWSSQHTQIVEREMILKREVEHWKAQVLDLKQRLYGKRSEKYSKVTTQQYANPPRKRGQQKGAPGHGRTGRSHLPVVEEIRDIAADERHCQTCGEPFLSFPKTEDSQIVEVHVQAHIRKIIRRQYLKGCNCNGTPSIITAPPAPRLIPKSYLGVSFWTSVLLDKYQYSRPTHRLCQDLFHHGLPVAQGTVTCGLKQLIPLLEPLVAAMYRKQMTEQLFHSDETGWKVFEKIEGKVGHRWYLWITQSASTIFYCMAPGRGADVPKAHFAGLAKGITEVIVVCDRYVAYKCLANDNVVIVLAFCWVHVRRDFLDAARSWPELETWMFTWVEDIRELYHLNARRLEFWEETKGLEEQSPSFMERHDELRRKLSQMKDRRDACLGEKLHSAQRKALDSLKNHWKGLTVFVVRPEVAMDNNTAERSVRNPVTGRKNYYGSGSVWSAHLAAMMFTLLQTVALWGINPRHWLYAFLHACAENGGKTPSHLSTFLPWEMSEGRKEELTRPLRLDRERSVVLKTQAPHEVIDTS